MADKTQFNPQIMALAMPSESVFGAIGKGITDFTKYQQSEEERIKKDKLFNLEIDDRELGIKSKKQDIEYKEQYNPYSLKAMKAEAKLKENDASDENIANTNKIKTLAVDEAQNKLEVAKFENDNKQNKFNLDMDIKNAELSAKRFESMSEQDK